mmetsp:Transcript_73564/g.207779  ORF Transcript_73564/g.207779 Transcript_73564/m.207779 type:complete len:216 (+) Transcript_73564:191-838(+)
MMSLWPRGSFSSTLQASLGSAADSWASPSRPRGGLAPLAGHDCICRVPKLPRSDDGWTPVSMNVFFTTKAGYSKSKAASPTRWRPAGAPSPPRAPSPPLASCSCEVAGGDLATCLDIVPLGASACALSALAKASEPVVTDRCSSFAAAVHSSSSPGGALRMLAGHDCVWRLSWAPRREDGSSSASMNVFLTYTGGECSSTAAPRARLRLKVAGYS